MHGTGGVVTRKIGDYAGVSRPHLDLVKSYSSPTLLGPPVCDELVALVEHMFTEEEAEIARFIKPWRPKSAASIAAAAGRPLPEVKEILRTLAHEKYVFISFGEGDRERFAMLPIIPGTFEHVLVRKSADSATPWHQGFAELFEALYLTRFTNVYSRKPVNAVRYLPVGEVVETLPMALPSERLEDILDPYREFAIGVCQCRLTKELIAQGCGRMLETCTVMGDFAPTLVKEGRMRQASRKDVLEVKAAAEREGLVTWMLNDRSAKFFRCSCSCCGCCCDALRQISEFNAPGFIAPPHFLPVIDLAACDLCGKCAKACTMKAMEVAGEGDAKSHVHKVERCIGCGVCVVTCPKGALSMRENKGYEEPPSGYAAYLAKYGRNFVANSFRVWAERRRVP
ncbi:MAG: 4Fe-4S dicluster domain-containing protein [Actinobacteria bacterium]|jgi:Pyruvate/2-oxoacid:ferredoxin oxidoreductase delta subunit|nr:MAG: 4Fe-4S dicluster domain-containing protein [Actinomycetota bacterium]